MLKKVLTGMFVLIACQPAVTNAATLDKHVYSPQKGVLCDKKVTLCADVYGLSAGITELYFGKKAAAPAIKKLANISDKTVFTFSNGLHCKTDKKECYVDKYSSKVDKASTIALFGGQTNNLNANKSSANNTGARVDISVETLNQQFANFLCGNSSDIESCVNSNIYELDVKLVNKTRINVNKESLNKKLNSMCKNMTDDPACPSNMMQALQK